MKPILYCATTNAGKLLEFQLALGASYTVELVPGMRGLSPPEETGSTFEENAALKAVYYSRHCGAPVFADDSGLEVNSLGGAPGVYSARYAGVHASSRENNDLLLEKMRDVEDRTARFVCVIAIAARGILTGSFRGEVEGELLKEPRGTHGFGYDPLFFCPALGRSFGEAAAPEKSDLSHRGKALRAMLEFLRSPSNGSSR